MDSYNVGIIVLLVFIGGFVTLIEQSGGADAFARAGSALANNSKRVQIGAWIGGMLIFFSELGTPMIVGPIFQPLFKKLRVSKEKLAWILDSTASPVCVLIPFIGWGVYSMGLIQTEFDALNITYINDWSAFIAAIPFQIYPILCLLMIPLAAASGKEFGAMAKAEENARKGIYSRLDPDAPQIARVTNDKVSALVVIIPLIVLFATLFGILGPKGFPVKQVPGSEFRVALITGYLFGAIAMIILMAIYKVKPLMQGISVYVRGFSRMFECIVILILAWSLSSVGRAIGTGNFIVSLASGNIPGWCVPAVIFILGSIISFATGTSWGTFAILMPIAIPLAVSMDLSLAVCIGAVLSGGLFGDHCSPISDTTILASSGADCSLFDHVKTQFPYAAICAALSIAGYLVAGAVNNAIVTIACAVALVPVFLFMSKYKGVALKKLTLADVELLDKQESVTTVR